MDVGAVGSRCLIAYGDLLAPLRINVQNIPFVACVFDDVFRTSAFVLDNGILRSGHSAVFQDQVSLIV